MDDTTRQEGEATEPAEAPPITSPTTEDQGPLEPEGTELVLGPGDQAHAEPGGSADALAGGWVTPDVDLPELEVLEDEEGGDEVDTEDPVPPAVTPEGHDDDPASRSEGRALAATDRAAALEKGPRA